MSAMAYFQGPPTTKHNATKITDTGLGQDFTAFNTLCFGRSITTYHFESKFLYFLTAHFRAFIAALLSPTSLFHKKEIAPLHSREH